MKLNRSLFKYRSTAKSVALATVFFASTVTSLAVSNSVLAEAESLTLAERVKHLEQLNQTRNKVQADISFQLSEIQREVRQLTGQVEDNTFKLKQIQDRQRDLYRDIENRLSGLASKPAVTRQTTRPVTSSSNTSSNSNAVSSSTNRSGSKEFEAAFALVRNKNYSGAIAAFDSFLKQYPNGAYSDNARYWMGQVYLVQGQLEQAETQFSKLLVEFPQSLKLSAAQLKLGDIYLKQGNWEKAKTQYTTVANSSKGSSLQLARKGLDKIKQAGH